MTKAAQTIGFAVALTLVGTTVPLHATISVQLAKTCRAMMVDVHPTQQFGRLGSAAEQRAYFTECIKRQAKMPPPKEDGTADQAQHAGGQAHSATTGQGSP